MHASNTVNPKFIKRRTERRGGADAGYHIETRDTGFYVVCPAGGLMGPYSRVREAAAVCGRLNQRGVTL